MRTVSHRLLLVAMLALGLTAACDSLSSSSSSNNGLTTCTYGYTVVNPNGGAIGTACTQNSDCKYNVCLKPSSTAFDTTTGDGSSNGNIINTKFGFCTRGCDCNNDTASQLTTTDKQNYTCLYPPGNQNSWHFVAVQCSQLSDCGNFASGWNDCALPVSGGALEVCQAQ